MNSTGALHESPPLPEVVVSTGHHPTEEQQLRAWHLAQELHAALVPRHGRSLEAVAAAARVPALPGEPRPGPPAVLVVERSRLSLHVGRLKLFYHPGMALNRLRRLAEGRPDPMVEAMRLRRGDTVVDATLGLGADALVASAVVGPPGRVTGLEKVAVLATLVREGLRSYPWPDPRVREAALRIEVRAADHRDHLAAAPAASADVVYFDVMFEASVPGSAAMAAWRRLAWTGAVDAGVVEMARRVARRCVVLKDRRDSARLERLAPPERVGGRSSRIVYGVWPALGS